MKAVLPRGLVFAAALGSPLWAADQVPVPPADVAPAVSAPAVRLSELEARRPKAPDSQAWETSVALAAEAQGLVETNTLFTADEFYRAAKLVAAGESRFRAARMHYELLLTAVALGHAQAAKELAAGWDQFLESLGRPLRTDFQGRAKAEDEVELQPTASSVVTVLRDPAAAREAADKTIPNPEMQQIVDADQADRRGTIKPEDWAAIGARDRQREKRTLALLETGAIRTAADFANASLVMQHSSGFRGYEVAHELAVCSLLLGDRRLGRWLVAATYDRMLGSVGHEQRFGTQYIGRGGKSRLQRVDPAGICDAERVALGCPTLEQAKHRDRTANDSSQELVKSFVTAEGTIRDPGYGLEAPVPAGWRLRDAMRWGDQQNTLYFVANVMPEAHPSLYYRVFHEPQPMTAEALQAWYREEAVKKEASRREGTPDYRNRADSLEPCDIGGRPGFRWTADWMGDDGKPWREYMVNLRTESGNAFFFLQAPAADTDKLRAAVDEFMARLKMPPVRR